MDSIATLRVLIVEDTPQRQEILKQLYREHAWILVGGVGRAIRLLDAYEFDVISLDYDLHNETGDGIAARIAGGRNASARVVVHSMNPQGRQKIAALLPNAVLLPVSAMTKTNVRFKRLREALRDGRDFDWAFAEERERNAT